MSRDMEIGGFEQGPIRPPSEAGSLLVRTTRNCPWNRCAFCHTYRQRRFSLRPVEEIKGDILRMAEIAEEIRSLSRRCGEGDRIGERTLSRIFSGKGNGDCRSVAAWLGGGAESVFLQDADALIMKTEDLAEAVAFIRKTFPSVRRITTYARSKSASRKTAEELKRLREAGLSRIHVGMESGLDPLLLLVQKGATAEEQVEGGRKIREAGISLCEYVMPGLGGREWSREHALATADALNRIDPDHIRLRTLQAVPGTELARMIEEGEFQPLDDEEILREIRLLIENLEGIGSEIVSDHILNLLEELQGKLPGDREKLLGVIDRFFSLSPEERMIFRLGRRMGVYRRLDDLSDAVWRTRFQDVLDEYRRREPFELEEDLARIRSRHI